MIPTIPTLFLNVGVLVRWYMRMAVGYDGNDKGEYSEIYVQVACKIACMHHLDHLQYYFDYDSEAIGDSRPLARHKRAQLAGDHAFYVKGLCWGYIGILKVHDGAVPNSPFHKHNRHMREITIDQALNPKP